MANQGARRGRISGSQWCTKAKGASGGGAQQAAPMSAEAGEAQVAVSLHIAGAGFLTICSPGSWKEAGIQVLSPGPLTASPAERRPRSGPSAAQLAAPSQAMPPCCPAAAAWARAVLMTRMLPCMSNSGWALRESGQSGWAVTNLPLSRECFVWRPQFPMAPMPSQRAHSNRAAMASSPFKADVAPGELGSAMLRSGRASGAVGGCRPGVTEGAGGGDRNISPAPSTSHVAQSYLDLS